MSTTKRYVGRGEGTRLLDRRVSYAELVDAGGLDLMSEPQLRHWFGGQESITVADVLAQRTHPARAFWAVLRERVLPSRVLHRVALAYAEEFLERTAARHTYVDFRTRRGLAALRAWLDDEISLGELHIARLQAEQAWTTVTGLGDPLAASLAQLACQAMADRGQEALDGVFTTFTEHFDTREDLKWLVQTARELLARHDDGSRW